MERISSKQLFVSATLMVAALGIYGYCWIGINTQKVGLPESIASYMAIALLVFPGLFGAAVFSIYMPRPLWRAVVGGLFCYMAGAVAVFYILLMWRAYGAP
jgi:hypothetical protein